MTTDQTADIYFTTIRDMLHNGIITAEEHDKLQRKVNQWAELPSEQQAYGTCASGQCEF